MINPLLEQDLRQDVQERESFKIKDLESCTWAFRKIRAYNEKKKEVLAVAQKELDRIKAWAEEETKDIDSSIEFFQGLLTEYYAEQKALDPKFKSISTPYGTVSARKSPDKLEYNEEAFMEWAENFNLSLIRIKQEINKEEAKKYFKITEEGAVIDPETGELVEFARYVQGETKITIKVKEE